MPKVDPWVFINADPDAFAFIKAMADPDLTSDQRSRLLADRRLIKSCDACEHPGYMHEHAEEQFKADPFGTFTHEAFDINCEADGCGCGWYESDNWQQMA